MSVPRGEIGALTGLRAIAALWVFAFHLQMRAPLVPDGPLARLVDAGAIGMTLFFVLSGYVLALATRDGLPDWRAFARARAARIYPLYAVAAVMALPWLLAPGPAALDLVVVAAIGALMLQAWFPHLFGVWNHAASWSLSVEAAFYAVFPALRSAVAPLAVPILWAVVAAACGLSALFAVAHHAVPGDPGFAFAYANPLFRLPEFAAGIAFGQLALRGVRVPGHWVAGALICAVCAVAAIGTPGVPTLWAAPATLVTGLGLIHLTHARSSWLASDAMRFGGRISYAFYLFQFHVILGLPHLVPMDGPEYWLAALALTTGIAILAHALVERPARAWIARPAGLAA